MRRKLILLTSFVLVLGLALTRAADGAPPRLIGWWRFDGDTLDSRWTIPVWVTTGPLLAIRLSCPVRLAQEP